MFSVKVVKIYSKNKEIRKKKRICFHKRKKELNKKKLNF